MNTVLTYVHGSTSAVLVNLVTWTFTTARVQLSAFKGLCSALASSANKCWVRSVTSHPSSPAGDYLFTAISLVILVTLIQSTCLWAAAKSRLFTVLASFFHLTGSYFSLNAPGTYVCSNLLLLSSFLPASSLLYSNIMSSAKSSPLVVGLDQLDLLQPCPQLAWHMHQFFELHTCL